MPLPSTGKLIYFSDHGPLGNRTHPDWHRELPCLPPFDLHSTSVTDPTRCRGSAPYGAVLDKNYVSLKRRLKSLESTKPRDLPWAPRRMCVISEEIVPNHSRPARVV